MPLPAAITRPSPLSYYKNNTHKNNGQSSMEGINRNRRRRRTTTNNNAAVAFGQPHGDLNPKDPLSNNEHHPFQRRRQQRKTAKNGLGRQLWNEFKYFKKFVIPIVMFIILLFLVLVKQPSSTTTTRQSRRRRRNRHSTAASKHSTASALAGSSSSSQQQPQPHLKTILYYTKYWSFDDFQFGMGHEPFVHYNCPVSDCYATNNRSFLSSMGDFDAVMFHMIDFENVHQEAPQIYHTWKRPHQRFTLVQMESPSMYGYNYEGIPPHFFNWTMTYRHDSDIVRPYGYFEPLLSSTGTNSSKQSTTYPQPRTVLPSPPLIQFDMDTFVHQDLPFRDPQFHQLAHRPHKVAWIVSNCHTPSKREAYVYELSKYIQVDIFGKCGGGGGSSGGATTTLANTSSSNNSQYFTCNTTYRVDRSDNCSIYVEQNYKFYLAFENSFCQDYVTEKFFSHMKNAGPEEEEKDGQHSYPLVPIVLGQANYSQIAPTHSYIDVFDFTSPQHLADYLHSLNDFSSSSMVSSSKQHTSSSSSPNHTTEATSLYLSYFWWTKYYKVHTASFAHYATSMCDLCAKLHETNEVEEDGTNSTSLANEYPEKVPRRRHRQAMDNHNNHHKSYQDIKQWWKTESQCDVWKPKLIQQLSKSGTTHVGPFGETGGGGGPGRLRMSWNKA